MSKKKITLSLISIIVAILLMTIPNTVKAKTPLTTPMYFGINEYRKGTTPENLAYAIGNPLANGSTPESIVGAKIWQIVKYDNKTSNTYVTGNYYCVRAGIGFSDTTTKAEYTISYDFKTEKSEIASSGNSVLQNLVNSSYYNNLLALTDLVYLKGVSTDEEKTALLNAAGIYAYDANHEDGYENLITDSDIEAVQQAAMWYFTNHDDTAFAKVYDQFGDNKTSWLFYRTLEMAQNGTSYRSLSDYDLHMNSFGSQTGAGLDRQEQAVLLYNYLIKTANTNASSYANGTANSRTKVTLYANPSIQNTQPIILIERAPETKEFDLALRKYITKVNGTELSGASSRVPNIDLSTLNSGTTATYKHKKDPVTVTTGSVVTYKLTVYNEGEKTGRATKIVDQLPTGLTLKTTGTVTSTKGNTYKVAYDESTNKATFTTTGEQNLNAYDGKTLDSDTIEIECTVVATPNTTKATVLTNVAWISEEYDAVSKLTITNQNGKDRDSEPSTTPSVNKDNMENYTGNNNKQDLTDSNNYYKGQQDDDDFEKLIINKQDEGSYNLVLVKEDANGEQLNSKATFKVNGETKEVVGKLTIANVVKINSSNVSTNDVYTIEEIVAPDEYCKFNGKIIVTVEKTLEGNTYKVKSITRKILDANGNDVTSTKGDSATVEVNADGNLYVKVKNYQFDLKLVKRIYDVNGTKVPDRIMGVDVTKLANGTATTADYKLDKEPVSVKNGDIVKYTLRVYNEGDVDGYASEITEDVPEGLEFMWSEKVDSDLEADTTLSKEEKEAIKYNQGIWDIKTINKETNKIELITTDYLAKGKGAEKTTEGANLIKAFDKTKGYVNTINDKNPDYKEVSVYMKVTAANDVTSIIRNEAAITGDTDKDGNPIDDRDSDTEKWIKYEDDEDYDNIILQSFDLALRKFIIAVGKDTELKDSDYLKNSNGSYTRAPIVDTSKLNTTDENGKLITTAIYNHTKEPVELSVNDYVIYMLRVYNEGDIAGYASEIKDHLPEYLEYVDGEFNDQYKWSVSEDGRTVTTKYLSNYLIDATTTDDNGKIILSYKEVPIMCKVKDTAKSSEKITNIADITEYRDEDKNIVTDRDSKSDNLIIPVDSELPGYKDDEKGDYIPGQEDDDDFEKVVVRTFDLALRKWVTQAIVIENGKETVTETGHKAEDDPEQVVKVELNRKKLNSLTVKFKYSIRVTNEGDVAGYAKEITDYVPEGLKFVAEDNSDWTDEGNNVISTRKLENTLLQPGESAEVEVLLTWINGKDNLGLKVNTAEISEDYNDKHLHDIDSTPDNKVPGEDDIDDAPVLLSVSTGQTKIYFTLGFIVLITIAGGIVLIKKFVL